MSIWASFENTGLLELQNRDEYGEHLEGNGWIDVATSWHGHPVVRLIVHNEDHPGRFYLKKHELELLVKALQTAIGIMEKETK